MRRVYITGGGTGGHIYPALAICDIVKKLDFPISYFGNKNRMEGQIVPKKINSFIHLNMIGMPRKISLLFIKFLFLLLLSLMKSAVVFIKNRPVAVIGTGGFVTFAPLLMGKLFGAKIIIHEQNSYPGIVNRVISRIADVVFVGFDDVKKYFKKNTNIVVVGNPIFTSVKDKNQVIEKFEKDFIISVVGGSSGAKIINKIIEKNIELFNRYGAKLILVTGKLSGDYERLKAYNSKFIIVKDYCYNMKDLYEKSDLIVCRSGAMTIFELIENEVPALLIPFKYATANHQYFNAQYLVDRGCALVIEEKDLEEKFLFKIKKILENKDYVKDMKKNYKSIEKIDTNKIIMENIKLIIGDIK